MGQITINYRETDYSGLLAEQRAVLDAAERVMPNSHSIYSRFSVGAAVETAIDGKVIPGVNVENSAYGNVGCAEGTAIRNAVTQGYKSFRRLAVIGKGKNPDETEVVGPCGRCRQDLIEFYQLSGVNTEVIMSTANKGRIIITSIDDLLPFPFGPKNLGIDTTQFRSSH